MLSAYVRTLQKLTDDAPTVPLADVAAVFEADMGPLRGRSTPSTSLPVAAGLLAQVHRALCISSRRRIVRRYQR